MSSKTISLAHKIGGAPADLTTCEFGSPTAVVPAFGLRKQSDLSIIVAAGVDFTHDDVGEYSSVVTGLEEGVTYEYYIHTEFEGVERWHSSSFVAGASSEDLAEGLYANESDLDDLRGIDNITVWSDLENTNARNHARIQRAFNGTDAKIRAALERAYAFPLSPLSDQDRELLRGWSAVLTAYELYRMRGQRDGISATGRIINLYAGDAKEVMDEIWSYANRKRFLTSTKTTNTPIVAGGSSRVIYGDNGYIDRFGSSWFLIFN